VRLREKRTLNLWNFHRTRAFLVVVRHAINVRLIRLSFVVAVLIRDGALGMMDFYEAPLKVDSALVFTPLRIAFRMRPEKSATRLQ
jgi:hypothetical protein